MKKIAVLRVNALGDFIFVLPALQALRETFPDAEIVYLGNILHKKLLSGRPGPVNRVVIIPRYPGVGENADYQPDEAEVIEFFNRMRAERFDVAFQLHGGGRYSNAFVSKLGAKLTVGLKTPDAPPLDISVPYIHLFSEILRYLEVVSYVGARTPYIEPHLAVTEHDLQEAAGVLMESSAPIAVIQPVATDVRRCWAPENFAAIADFLATQGMMVYINGTPAESNVADQVMKHITHTASVKNVCGQLSVCGLTGLLSQAFIVVSNDTGPLHLATALQTPTIGIYWCGNMITSTPMTCSFHRTFISWVRNCPLCGMDCFKFSDSDPCKHHVSFVNEVNVADVETAAKELMIACGLQSVEI